MKICATNASLSKVEVMLAFFCPLCYNIPMSNRHEVHPIKQALHEAAPYAAATIFAASRLFSPESANSEPVDTTPVAAEPAPIAPGQLANRIDQLIVPSVQAWSNRQLPNGQLKDPIKGATGSYGSPMTAQAMIEVGVSQNNPNLINAGLKIEKAQLKHPDNGGFNVGFEVIGLVDAVKQNDAILANNDQWQTLRDPMVKFISQRYKRGVESKTKNASDLARCMVNPRCFYNLKLVGATASIDYHSSKIGVNTSAKSSSVKPDKKAQASFKIGNPAGKTTLAAGANEALLNQAARLTSKDARGSSWPGEQLGILSDPAVGKSNNPLAYNALCAMMLGHALEAKGYDTASPSVRSAFERTTKSIVGYMAPNGETSYIGRGQGQVWVSAIALNALAIAAKNADDPTWKSRYINASNRLVEHLESEYTPDQQLGLPLVPRLKGKNANNVSYNGLDHYASYNMYEGLALFGLRKARDILKNEAVINPVEIGSDIDSTYVDPSQTKFASVKAGNIWYAIHGGDAVDDARYDFGVVAAQKKVGDTWVSAMSHRPYSSKKTSAGGAMRIKGKTMLPTARKVSSNGNGVVTMHGGWTDKPNGRPTLDRNTKWTFTPTENGVNMEFTPKSNRRYEFTAWYEAGSRLTPNSKGLTVVEPNGRQQTYTFNKSVSVRRSKSIEHSGYNNKLQSSQIVLKAKKGNKISYTTSFN